MERTIDTTDEDLGPVWLRLWGKTPVPSDISEHHTRRFHPLLFHMLDVAAVAGLIWDHCLDVGIRERISRSLGEDTRKRLMFWTGAHDLGKASPGFQKRMPELASSMGLPFSENYRPARHGFITAHELSTVVDASQAVGILAQLVGGHHGVFPRSEDLLMGQDTLGGSSWDSTRRSLLQEFGTVIGCDLRQASPAPQSITDPGLLPVLAGLVSVADWIGSNQTFFPCCVAPGTSTASPRPADYWTRARVNARQALESLGWMPAVTFAEEAPFDAVFQGFLPNAVQTAVMEAASRQSSAYLLIVEAPMGQGKTEAALYAADIAMCRGVARGMYVAMPTQATSTAMFTRVLEGYLRRRGHKGKLNLQLVHGDALLARTREPSAGEITQFSPQSIGQQSDAEAQSWFTARKRPLLAPFGVGTIDQSLLSVLQTRHWFVRLSGLAGKVVVFDEVHAYDTYMSAILERLLHWLAEVDCTVILLSATLPDNKRRALTRAYSGRDDSAYVRYPRVTLARAHHYPASCAESRPECFAIATEGQRTVHVHSVATEREALTSTLAEYLEDGGCAAVICTTVDRAIEVYRHLRYSLTDTECLLFHARTLRSWRSEREADILRRFGKGDVLSSGICHNSNRPHRAVLVATQVVEQSLDLDFDLMMSEIAPIDLLLQRSGRLHRHRRPRPGRLADPRLLLVCDAGMVGPPPVSFGASIEYIYQRYILLRTWLTIRKREEIVVPDEVEGLVEAVYGDQQGDCDDVWLAALAEAETRMDDRRNECERAARRLLVGKPRCASDLIEDFNSDLGDDDDPCVHESVRAATRLGPPSITVVMIPKERVLEPDPDMAETRELLESSVSLTHRGIFRALREDAAPREWASNAHLRHARLLRLNGEWQGRVGDFLVTADKECGVSIEKDGAIDGRVQSD